MTYREWEAKLLGYLKSLTADEIKEIKDYYAEIYSDKTECGMVDEEIVRQFGEPEVCAARILMESGENTENEEKNDTVSEKSKQNKDTVTPKVSKPKSQKPLTRGISVGEIIGVFFFVILLVIPIEVIFLSVLISIGAVALSGAVMAIVGILATVISPLTFAVGYSFAGFMATLGTALATAGIGAILVPIFVPLTKYTAIGFIKVTKLLFKRR